MMNCPYESERDWRIRSTCNSLSIFISSFWSSSMSLIIVKQWSLTDYPSRIFALKNLQKTSKQAMRLCSSYNSCKWTSIPLAILISSCCCWRSLDMDAKMYYFILLSSSIHFSSAARWSMDGWGGNVGTSWLRTWVSFSKLKMILKFWSQSW